MFVSLWAAPLCKGGGSLRRGGQSQTYPASRWQLSGPGPVMGSALRLFVRRAGKRIDEPVVNVKHFFRRVASSEDVTEAPSKDRWADIVGRVVVPWRANLVAKATRGAPGEAQRGVFAGNADAAAARSSPAEPR